MPVKRVITLFDEIIKRQYDATQWRPVFDSSMVLVTNVIERDTQAHKVLHTDQNDVWIYAMKTLTLYDKKIVEKETLNLATHIYDMALTASQDIIGSDRDNKCLVKILPSGIITTFCSTAPLTCTPWGICINNRQQIVVGLKTDQASPHIKLAIYTPDGSTLLQEIKHSEDDSPLFRKEIVQVKQNGIGDYVVSSYDTIVCISSQGTFRWEYCVESSTGIYGIVCDKYNNVIIAEFGVNKISLLNSEGKLVTILLTKEDGIDLPGSLSIDRYGQLWIGQVFSLKVVKYLK